MRRMALLSIVLAMLLSTAGRSWAQTATGQIMGTVKDASGAVMAGAKVTLTNQGTNLTRETTTSETGDYVFPLLPVGVYSVSALSCGVQDWGHALGFAVLIGVGVEQVGKIEGVCIGVLKVAHGAGPPWRGFLRPPPIPC